MKVDVYDSDDIKLSATQQNDICKDCNFYNPDTTTRRKHNIGKPSSPANREKCIKQKIVRDSKGVIIGLKSWWVKI